MGKKRRVLHSPKFEQLRGHPKYSGLFDKDTPINVEEPEPEQLVELAPAPEPEEVRIPPVIKAVPETPKKKPSPKTTIKKTSTTKAAKKTTARKTRKTKTSKVTS